MPSLLLVWHLSCACLCCLLSCSQPGYFLFPFMFLYIVFFPALPLVFLHSGSPRGPQPRHGQAGARHRWVPLLAFIVFCFTSLLWSHSSCHLSVKQLLTAQTQQKSGNLCPSAPWGGKEVWGVQGLGGSAAIPHFGLAKGPGHGRAELVMDSCFLSCRMTQGIVRLTWMKMKRRRRRIWKMTAWKSPQANPASEQGSQSHWSRVIMTSDPSVAGGLLKHQLWRGLELIPCCLKSVCQCEFRSL